MTLLTAWTFRPLLLIVIGGLGLAWWRGRVTSPEPMSRSQNRRLGLSMLVLFVALCSPLNSLAHQFLFLRVAQHVLLVSLFPALFMGSNALPTMWAGLPAGWRAAVRPVWVAWRPWLQQATPKGICWFVFVAAVWVWYDPTMLALTLTRPWLYDLSLLTMLMGALLHWWHVTAAWPRLHGRLPGFAHMGYTLAGAAPLKIPGLFLLFAYAPFYSFPAGSFLGYEISPLLSQQIGGILVWTLGGTVYSTTALGFMANWLDVEEKKPILPAKHWDRDENFIAPHLE